MGEASHKKRGSAGENAVKTKSDEEHDAESDARMRRRRDDRDRGRGGTNAAQQVVGALR